MIDPIYAGHAGGEGSPLMFPHELLGAVTVLAVIGAVLIILAFVGIWLLLRINRRLDHTGPPSNKNKDRHPT